MKSLFVVLVSAGLVALPGCADYGRPSSTSAPSSSYAPAAAPSYSAYGVVSAVRVVDQPVGTSGGGMLLGGVVGGLLGHQVGSGRGNTVTTIGGAAAGAYVGNEIERSQSGGARRVYEVEVRMKDGSYQTVTGTDGSFHVGDRVRLRDGVLTHR